MDLLGSRLIELFKILLFCATFGAHPIVRKIFKSRSDLNVAFSITFFRVVDIATGAFPFIHQYLFLPVCSLHSIKNCAVRPGRHVSYLFIANHGNCRRQGIFFDLAPAADFEPLGGTARRRRSAINQGEGWRHGHYCIIGRHDPSNVLKPSTGKNRYGFNSKI